MTLRDTVSLTARARRLLGWGAASVDVRPLFFGDALLPHFSRAIDGYEVVDTNGRRYVDCRVGDPHHGPPRGGDGALCRRVERGRISDCAEAGSRRILTA